MTDHEITIATMLAAIVGASLILSGWPSERTWKAVVVGLGLISAGCGGALLYLFLAVFGYLS